MPCLPALRSKDLCNIGLDHNDQGFVLHACSKTIWLCFAVVKAIFRSHVLYFTGFGCGRFLHTLCFRILLSGFPGDHSNLIFIFYSTSFCEGFLEQLHSLTPILKSLLSPHSPPDPVPPQPPCLLRSAHIPTNRPHSLAHFPSPLLSPVHPKSARAHPPPSHHRWPEPVSVLPRRSTPVDHRRVKPIPERPHVVGILHGPLCQLGSRRGSCGQPPAVGRGEL